MTPTPETHYEWELTDANGERKAGGSVNEYTNACAEAMRYLNKYALNGRYALTVREHETTTVSEATIGTQSTTQL
jgi:hypothetical protein